MGLYVDRLEFAGEPPSLEELTEHLRAQVGDTTGLEGWKVEGRSAELSCMLDPYTRPYALAFLVGRGASVFDLQGRRVHPVPHDFLATPWRELSRWRRLKLRLAYWRALGKGPRW